VRLLGAWIEENGIADAPRLRRIESDAQREIEDGVAFALDAPYPDPSEVDMHVYA
jgi:TPP-dependent pyruvate/acetoin dehydrogenase alpha subunit